MRTIDPRGRSWEVVRETEREIFKVDLTIGSVLMGGALLFFWLLIVANIPEHGLPVIHILPWWVKAVLMIIAMWQKRWGWLMLTILIAIPYTLLKILVWIAPLGFIALAYGSQSWTITAYADDGEEWEAHVKGYFRSLRKVPTVVNSIRDLGIPEKDPKVFVRVDS